MIFFVRRTAIVREHWVFLAVAGERPCPKLALYVVGQVFAPFPFLFPFPDDFGPLSFP